MRPFCAFFRIGYIYPSQSHYRVKLLNYAILRNRFRLTSTLSTGQRSPLNEFYPILDSLLWLSYFTYFTVCYLQNVSANCEVCQLGEVA